MHILLWTPSLDRAATLIQGELLKTEICTLWLFPCFSSVVALVLWTLPHTQMDKLSRKVHLHLRQFRHFTKKLANVIHQHGT